MSSKHIPGYKKIATRFKGFNKEMRDIWETFNLINFYLPVLHNSVKNASIPPLSFSPLLSTTKKTIKIDDTLGAFAHLRLRSNPRNSFVEAVIVFEDFLSFLFQTVYKDFPGKLLSKKGENNLESLERKSKLMNTILNSNDKDEIVEKIIEEKARSIFYGNIALFFLKDTAKLEYKDYFKGPLKVVIENDLAEIMARRNIVVHNNGRVDRKYIRESSNKTIKLGTMVKISEDYIKHTITTLQGIASHAGGRVIEKIYKKPVLGKIKYIRDSYDSYLKANCTQ
jgi:hypothetical protein